METNHKTFKPFDKVLVKYSRVWVCTFYSHFDENSNCHYTMAMLATDEEILPYEGNEHLVGTTDEPDEEVKLEEGELIIATAHINRIEKGLGTLERFKEVGVISFKVEDYDSYAFAIPFSKFNPNDMEETKKHILCVKNGKIVKYKG